MFSILNVEAARLARHGQTEAAIRVAQAAAELEADSDFRRLQQLLSKIPANAARDVLTGVLPLEAPDALLKALRMIARRTEYLRVAESTLARLADVVAGRVSEVHENYVILSRSGGPNAMIPRWMAVAARREGIGDLIVLITDKLHSSSAIVDAVPAIETEGDQSEADFSPFGRDNPRIRALSPQDTKLLSGEPAPLTVLVPVTFEA
jgi:hypothetical protein